MMSEVKVHESSLEKVRVGMPVRITVDALPGRSYAGTVTKIGLLPDAQMRWLNPDVKMYSTQVDIVGDTAGLKPGMSCRAEIFVERHEQVLYVPVQSVVRVGGQQVVYVQMPTGVEMRPVTTGLDNRHMIHVQAGLSTGEKVLLAPPLDAANAAALEYEDGDSLDADGAETGSVPGPAADANSAPAAPERGAARGEAAAASGTAAAPTPADAAAEGAGLSELMSKMRSLPRTERRAWMESLPAAQREQLLQQFRRTRGERGGGSDRPQGGGRQARGEGDA